MNSPTASILGEVGLPMSMRELASRAWDVIIVGAGPVPDSVPLQAVLSSL